MAIAYIDDWRRPGCDRRCQLATTIAPGLLSRVTEPAHDPDAHEEYGRLQSTGGRQAIVRTAAVVVNLTRGTVEIEGQNVRLPGAEWRVLRVLAEQTGAFCSLDDLARGLWPEAGGALWRGRNHSVRISVYRLRWRLGRAHYLIENQPFHGYRLRLDPVSALLPPVTARRWALKWSACRACGTTARAHDSKGYCTACRWAIRRAERREASR